MAKTTQNAPAKQEEKKITVDQLLKSPGLLKEMERVLPNHLTPDRMMRILTTEVRKVPELAHCDPLSFTGAVMEISRVGLEIGSHAGEAYLIPFNNNKKGIKEVQVIFGYRGLIKLALQSDQVKKIEAGIVRLDDFFEVHKDHGIDHRPNRDNYEIKKVGNFQLAVPKEKSAIFLAYAEATLASGLKQNVILDMEQVLAARSASKSPGMVWDKFFEEMAMKTAVRRLAKWIPYSTEKEAAERMRRVQELEEMTDVGISQGNRAAIDEKYERDFCTETEKHYAQVLEEAATPNGPVDHDEIRLEALEAVKATVDKLVKSGSKKQEIFKFLSIKSDKELDGMTVDQLTQVNEALEMMSS